MRSNAKINKRKALRCWDQQTQASPVPRLTNPNLGSCFDSKIVIFRFGFLLWRQDLMNLWVRYKEKRKSRKNEGENEERKIKCLRLRLVRVKAFPENRYFPEMLFSGKENVFMCLVAFQKNFWKIFSDVWLYSWKYHKKHIFYLLLTFSHIFSAPKQTHNVIHS